MTTAIQVDRWMGVLGEEYLGSFIREGGAAMKFAIVPDRGTRAKLITKLQAIARTNGFAFALVDGRNARIHQMDQIFFSVAAQVDWNDLALRTLANLAADAGYQTPDTPAGSFLERLAMTNGIEPALVKMELQRKLGVSVFRHAGMAKDFRIALMQLCMGELAGGNEREVIHQTITDWLTGRNKAISAVKPYQIFNRIIRTNARHHMESLLQALRLAGYAGLSLVLDISRLFETGRSWDDGSLRYSKAMVLDAYEVLRQFLDSTERFPGLFSAVLAPDSLLDEEHDRSVEIYSALKYRIYDEVRDRHIPNPMASLLRIAPAEGGAE